MRPWIIKAPVFWPSIAILALLVLFAALAPTLAGVVFERVNTGLANGVGWWYILSVTLILIFVVALAISPFGKVRLGPDNSEPRFRTRSWFAMLFSAGMGIGLVFYGVAEPVSHYGFPPRGVPPETPEAADQAFALTYFHWGLHAWAVYAIVGLGLGYAAHRRGRPLAVRYLLEPLIGRERTEGWIGHSIDVFAIVGTVCGVATSLGLGVVQINAGLDYLGVIPVNTRAQIFIIVVVTTLAALSVASGLDKGIKLLSNINLGVAGALALMVLVLGSTVFILNTWVQGFGDYLTELVPLSFTTDAFGDSEDKAWFNAWTIFYWGWWISWSPFVGMFIARISRGRTIREFVAGVLIAPLAVTTAWFAVFGGSGIDRDLNGEGGMVDLVASNLDAAIFELFQGLPLSTLLTLVAIGIIAVFFVTSADSGSLVVDTIASGGNQSTPRTQRVSWALLLGIVAIVLLVSGGLIALQTATIAAAAPVSVILVGACVGLLRALQRESKRQAKDLEPESWELGEGEPVVDDDAAALKRLHIT